MGDWCEWPYLMSFDHVSLYVILKALLWRNIFVIAHLMLSPKEHAQTVKDSQLHLSMSVVYCAFDIAHVTLYRICMAVDTSLSIKAVYQLCFCFNFSTNWNWWCFSSKKNCSNKRTDRHADKQQICLPKWTTGTLRSIANKND